MRKCNIPEKIYGLQNMSIIMTIKIVIPHTKKMKNCTLPPPPKKKTGKIPILP